MQSTDNLGTDSRVHLYWFSGSGNTLLAALAFARSLAESGVAVQLSPIETADPKQFDPETILVLAFPTHCFTIPEFVRQFVLQLPNGNNTPAVMITTAGALSGGVHGPLKRILTRKKFCCVAARQIRMPDSFFVFPRGKKAEKLIRVAEEKAARFAQDFLSGKSSWRRVPIISDLFAATLRRVFGNRNLLRPIKYMHVYAKKEKCTRCEVCISACPVNALAIAKSGLPEPSSVCTLCLRCVAICPFDAMRLHLLGLPPYRSEEATRLLERIRKHLVAHEQD